MAHPETNPTCLLLIVTVITNMLQDLRVRSGALHPAFSHPF